MRAEQEIKTVEELGKSTYSIENDPFSEKKYKKHVFLNTINYLNGDHFESDNLVTIRSNIMGILWYNAELKAPIEKDFWETKKGKSLLRDIPSSYTDYQIDEALGKYVWAYTVGLPREEARNLLSDYFLTKGVKL